MEETFDDGVAILTVMDNRIDARMAPELRRVVMEAVDRGNDRVTLDLTHVDFVDSSGLGMIVTILKLVGRKGDLALCGAREGVLDLFRLTRLDRVFRLYPTSTEAVAALAA
ncbi:MAG: STAS domain-containing protein [Acidobacteriota bacterium]